MILYMNTQKYFFILICLTFFFACSINNKQESKHKQNQLENPKLNNEKINYYEKQNVIKFDELFISDNLKSKLFMETNKGNSFDDLSFKIKFPEIFPIVETNINDYVDISFVKTQYYNLYLNKDLVKLPYYKYKLLVPNDADSFSIKLDSKNISYKNPKIALSMGKSNSSENNKDYLLDTELVKISEKKVFREYTFIELEVYPVSYQSNKNLIEQVKNLSFKLTYSAKKNINKTKNSIFSKILKSNFINASNYISSIKSKTLNGTYKFINISDLLNPNYDEEENFWPNYLLLYSQSFQDSESINNLIEHRISNLGGAHTIALVSINDIYSTYTSGTKEEKIKNTIKFIYNNWRYDTQTPNLEYLLLVGDADYGFNNETWFLPTWYSNNSKYGYAGDNEYTCIDSSNDIPELMIGRLPSKNEAELSRITNKIINFESYSPNNQNHYGTRNLFLAGSIKIGDELNINGARNVLINNYQESLEYSNYESYNPNWPNFTFNEAGLISNLINNEGALIISYNGDGTESGFYPKNIDTDSISNPDTLTGLVISAASLNARFDLANNDSYAESWLKKENAGSISFFGASRNLETGLSYWLDELFIQNIYDDNIYILGALVLNSKLSSVLEEENDRSRFNFLGDPATNIQNYIAQSNKAEFETYLDADMPKHPLINDDIFLNLNIKNIGLSEATNIPVETFYVFAGTQTKIGTTNFMAYIEANATYKIAKNWTYQERFNEKFRVKVNMIEPLYDELSEFNNYYNGAYYVQYPLHINQNNTSGIEKGSYEYPFSNIDSGLSYLENFRLSEQNAKLYIYPGNYNGNNLNHFIANTSIIGIGSDINIENSYIQTQNSPYGPTIIENLRFKNYSPYIPIAVNGPTTLHQNFFTNCFAGFIINNTSNNEYIINVHNNIFSSNTSSFTYDVDSYVSNTKLNLINNVIYGNLYPMLIGSGDDFSNDVFLLNNIIWNNNYPIYEPYEMNIFSNYNDTDDDFLFTLDPYTNKNQNPEFNNPAQNNFHLLENSICIDAGDPDPKYLDQDGSINDMGAFGGPNKYIKKLTITNPIHQNSYNVSPISSNPGYPVLIKFKIDWDSNLIERDEILEVKIFHKEIVDDEYQIITDYEILVQNTGSYEATFKQNKILENYYLKIRKLTEQNVKDLVSFDINVFNK